MENLSRGLRALIIYVKKKKKNWDDSTNNLCGWICSQFLILVG